VHVLLAAVVLAGISPQHGIAGAKIGMTRAVVRSVVGTPRSAQSGMNDFGRYVVYVYPQVTVVFQSGERTTSISTTAPTQRVAGVGVGSTEAQVARSIRGVRCLTEGRYHHCYVGTWKPGHIVTDFALGGGRVTRVTVGIVLD
jgi:hypothetical protein